MANPTDKLSIHTKKYYRVVLEQVDRDRETLDSFAIKLSMRTRTPLPRVRQVLRRLPHAIKSGLSSAQANKLKSILEDIGGRARIETHFVTPGRSDPVTATKREPKEMVTVENRSLETCPECGWEDDSEAEFCPFCQHRYGASDEAAAEAAPAEAAPEKTAASPTADEVPTQETRPLTTLLLDNVLLIAAGMLVILLTILIFK